MIYCHLRWEGRWEIGGPGKQDSETQKPRGTSVGRVWSGQEQGVCGLEWTGAEVVEVS